MTAPEKPTPEARLWLWRNGDHYLAYEHEYPCYPGGGDPLTLGEPVGYAIFKPSAPPATPPPGDAGAMPGFFANLTTEQQRAALRHLGEDGAPPGDAGERERKRAVFDALDSATMMRPEDTPERVVPGDAGERAREIVDEWELYYPLDSADARKALSRDIAAALQSERTAAASQARRETLRQCMGAARGEDANGGAANEIAAAYIQGRLDAVSDIRALATPQESA